MSPEETKQESTETPESVPAASSDTFSIQAQNNGGSPSNDKEDPPSSTQETFQPSYPAGHDSSYSYASTSLIPGGASHWHSRN